MDNAFLDARKVIDYLLECKYIERNEYSKSYEYTSDFSDRKVYFSQYDSNTMISFKIYQNHKIQYIRKNNLILVCTALKLNEKIIEDIINKFSISI